MNKDGVFEINIYDVFQTYKKKAIVLVVVLLMFGIIGYLRPLKETQDVYNASSQIMLRDYVENITYLKNGEKEITYNYVDVSPTIMNTCIEIMSSDVIFDDVEKNLHLDKGSASKKSTIQASTISTQVIDIITTSTDKEQAIVLNDELVNVFKDKVNDIMKGKTIDVQILSSASINNVIFGESGSHTWNVVVMVMLGFILFNIYVLISLLTNKTVKRVNDIKRITSKPILSYYKPKTNIGNEISMNINLKYNNAKVINFTSISDNNIEDIVNDTAESFKYIGKNVLVIDFEKENDNGINELLNEGKMIKEVVVDNDFYSTIDSGKHNEHLLESIQSDRMVDLMKNLKNDYDIILLKSPLIRKSEIAYAVSSLSDITILDIKLESDKKDEIFNIINNYEDINTGLSGLIVSL